MINIASQPATVDLTDYGFWEVAATLLTGETDIALSENALELPAYAVALLTPKK